MRVVLLTLLLTGCATAPRMETMETLPERKYASDSAGARLLSLPLPFMGGHAIEEWAPAVLFVDGATVWEATSLDTPFDPVVMLKDAATFCDGELGEARCKRYGSPMGQPAVAVAMLPSLTMGDVRPLLLALAAKHIAIVPVLRCGSRFCGSSTYGDLGPAIRGGPFIPPGSVGTLAIELDRDVRIAYVSPRDMRSALPVAESGEARCAAPLTRLSGAFDVATRAGRGVHNERMINAGWVRAADAVEVARVLEAFAAAGDQDVRLFLELDAPAAAPLDCPDSPPRSP